MGRKHCCAKDDSSTHFPVRAADRWSRSGLAPPTLGRASVCVSLARRGAHCGGVETPPLEPQTWKARSALPQSKIPRYARNDRLEASWRKAVMEDFAAVLMVDQRSLTARVGNPKRTGGSGAERDGDRTHIPGGCIAHHQSQLSGAGRHFQETIERQAALENHFHAFLRDG